MSSRGTPDLAIPSAIYASDRHEGMVGDVPKADLVLISVYQCTVQMPVSDLQSLFDSESQPSTQS